MSRSALMIALLPAAVASSPPPSLSEVGERSFAVPTLEGQTLPLSDFLPAGRPAVVELWATWCGPCRKTVPRLVDLYTQHHARGLSILGLTIENPEADMEKVRAFASKEDVPYPLAFAPREVFQIMNRQEELAVPKIWVYDAQGSVVEHLTRYSGLAMRRVERAVRDVMEAD